ncbi:hypothetical protein HanRHA438_Chr11g0492841 [Helianthus annuus]|uniref:Uncharacterized protein n=1 Tax=Helianthus annuus TaxID=4232 RepID=A0A251TCM0_HELAN|nr:hypothetical protein HanXRQr2_Chr11g0479521 [Helianthus annuus]KAJ0500776.1 hypothetical protein HanHA300_Chr11g0393191 [Helianthus annuus]KAJ0516645.1 hypothetical protein HanHA89_Chr11g0416141 [Helianthus annuus]KAJ0684650.1 hypothetical protein HanLR1_Chr11g0393551 [Helianthus annuus]KAJ0869777.1 hypothetical protein HanRHA438_Chr11g0492841 [Helianthus annuus]
MVGLHQWWVDGDGFKVTVLTCYIAVVPNDIYQELAEWKLVVTVVAPIRKSGVQPGPVIRCQWHSRSQEMPHVLGHMLEQNVKEEFSQRMASHDQTFFRLIYYISKCYQ